MNCKGRTERARAAKDPELTSLRLCLAARQVIFYDEKIGNFIHARERIRDAIKCIRQEILNNA